MSTIRHYRELNVYQNAMDWTLKMAEQPEKWLIRRRVEQ